MPRRDLLLTEFVEDLRAAGRLVANDHTSGSAGELVDQLLREAVLRKGLKRLRDVQPHHLPVPRHRVLAVARLAQLSVVRKRLLRRRDAMKALQIRHAEPLQIRDLQRIEMRRDVAEGICPRITERRGIRHRPNPQRIDYNRKYSSIFLRVHTHTSFDRQVATPENQGLTIHSDYSRCDADAQ